MTKRDRSNESSVYISKQHLARLKLLADANGRTMRSQLERWIDDAYEYRQAPAVTISK